MGLLLPAASSKDEYTNLLDAAERAIDRVNKNPLLLPDFELALQLPPASSEVEPCNPSAELGRLSAMLGKKGRAPSSIFGPSCSAACESTAFLTGAIRLPQVAYSCSSDALSDKKAYPTVRFSSRSSGH